MDQCTFRMINWPYWSYSISLHLGPKIHLGNNFMVGRSGGESSILRCIIIRNIIALSLVAAAMCGSAPVRCLQNIFLLNCSLQFVRGSFLICLSLTIVDWWWYGDRERIRGWRRRCKMNACLKWLSFFIYSAVYWGYHRQGSCQAGMSAAISKVSN